MFKIHMVVLCNRVSHGTADSVAASRVQSPWFALQSVWNFCILDAFFKFPVFPQPSLNIEQSDSGSTVTLAKIK